MRMICNPLIFTINLSLFRLMYVSIMRSISRRGNVAISPDRHHSGEWEKFNEIASILSALNRSVATLSKCSAYVCSSRSMGHSFRIWRGHDSSRWSAAGIKFPEWSLKPAVRRECAVCTAIRCFAAVSCLVCIRDKNHWSCSVAVSLVFIERVAR